MKAWIMELLNINKAIVVYNGNLLKYICHYLCGILLWKLFILHNVRCSEEIGHSAILRETSDSVKRAILIPDPTQTIQSSGVIVGWHIYTLPSRYNQEVHLQVWRPIGEKILSSTVKYSFKLVGDIKVISLWNGYSHVLLYPEDRIHVQNGDVTGLYFPGFNPIPWRELLTCAEKRKHKFYYNPRGVKLGIELLFSDALPDWKPCRIYSYNATFMNVASAKRMDKRYHRRREKPYGKKVYGKYIPKILPMMAGSGQDCYEITALYITGCLTLLNMYIDVYK